MIDKIDTIPACFGDTYHYTIIPFCVQLRPLHNKTWGFCFTFAAKTMMNPLWNHPEPKLLSTTNPRASSWFPSFKVPKSSCATCHVGNSHSPPYVSILGFFCKNDKFFPMISQQQGLIEKHLFRAPGKVIGSFKITTLYFLGWTCLAKRANDGF